MKNAVEADRPQRSSHEQAKPIDASNTLNPQESTFHHIAFNVALEDFETEKVRLEGLGLKINATVHEWLHVRSMYFYDPEGNHLEFVAYDETVR